MNKRTIFMVALVSAVTALITAWSFGQLNGQKASEVFSNDNKLPANYASFKESGTQPSGYPVDFTAAATAATPAVVHIKTKINARTVTRQAPRSPFADLFGEDLFGDFFGGGGGQRQMRMPEQRASGSGVIITNDGYIITNNHVIENADEINVTLTNKKSYKAELIGADPSSDLAVLKIIGNGYPHLAWGNSDEVRLGQWVLAIGYPWSLDVTVTAGIVSAKARSLGLNRQKSNFPIEAFIQTDAAVNQGNSGGALVDTDGKLIGINSAIASQTGSYAGYSYAIPVNLARKIVGDLIKFGTVQRAFLGLEYPRDDISDEEIKTRGIKQGQGVYVIGVVKGGAAEAAGLKEGDYVTGINGRPILSGSEMIEQIAAYSPGDKITIEFTRDGKDMKGTTTLKNISGNTDLVKADTKSESLLRQLGGELITVEKKQAERWRIKGGVQVKSIGEGLLSTSRIQEEFVIISVNGQAVSTVDDLVNILSKAQGTVRLEGIYPGYEETYAYPLNLSGNPNKKLQEP